MFVKIEKLYFLNTNNTNLPLIAQYGHCEQSEAISIKLYDKIKVISKKIQPKTRLDCIIISSDTNQNNL